MSFTTFDRIIGFILLLFVCGLASEKAAAQVKIGDNPNTINSNSVLELESSSKGLLLPRLALVATNNPAPMNAFLQGMFVYNMSTNGSGATAVTPGIYYSDGTQWVRAGAPVQPPSSGVLQVEYTASQGQTEFATPAAITNINKVMVYRNGVNINCVMVNATTVALEISCVLNDKIKVVQLQ